MKQHMTLTFDLDIPALAAEYGLTEAEAVEYVTDQITQASRDGAIVEAITAPWPTMQGMVSVGLPGNVLGAVDWTDSTAEAEAARRSHRHAAARAERRVPDTQGAGDRGDGSAQGGRDGPRWRHTPVRGDRR